MAEQHQNAMKRIITGILITICFVSTGWYAYSIYQDYLQKKAEWDEEARETFREAVDMEVKKISQIPVQIIAVNVPEVSTLEEPYKEYVQWTSQYGERSYFIPFHKFQNSYITNWNKRIGLSLLLEEHPIAADTLNWRWDSLLIHRDIAVQTRVRCTITDVLKHTDTIYSEKKVVTDSLISIYLGHRCEVGLTGYIAYPRWWNTLTSQQAILLFLPWILCILFIVFHDRIMKVLYPQPIIVEKEIKEFIPVEKIIQAVDSPQDKIDEYKFLDGTRFVKSTGELHGANGRVVSLSPQEILMLTVFIEAESHQVAMDEVIDRIWGAIGNSAKFHRLLQRLRNSLKEVTYVTIKNTGRGVYQLIQTEETGSEMNRHKNL